MSGTNRFELPEKARGAIFKRGGSREQYKLMDRLWDGLKQRFPDADCRPQQRYVGMYLDKNTDATFARLNSKKSGPVIGIRSSVVDAYDPVYLQSQRFAEWGGDQKGFHLEESSLWELHELLILAYRYKKDRRGGQHTLRNFQSHKQEQQKRSEQDIEALREQEYGTEGATTTRTSRAAERDSKLRTAAIMLHGLTCKACGFNFEVFYGEMGRGFIEVHHTDPFGMNPGVRKTNPDTDLEVLCANCHRMVHPRKGEVLAVEELRQIIEENQD